MPNIIKHLRDSLNEDIHLINPRLKSDSLNEDIHF